LASDNISLRALNDDCEKSKKSGKGDSKKEAAQKTPVGKEKSAKAKEEEYIASLKKEVLRLSQIEESCDESGTACDFAFGVVVVAFGFFAK
jgi:hypothetical protein